MVMRLLYKLSFTKMRKNIGRFLSVLFIVALILIVLVMIFFINKKEGFHCDEVFSYGSSNSTYSNVFYSYWKIDPEKLFFDEYVMQGNVFDIIGNVKYYYIDNTEERDKTKAADGATSAIPRGAAPSQCHRRPRSLF